MRKNKIKSLLILNIKNVSENFFPNFSYKNKNIVVFLKYTLTNSCENFFFTQE